MPTRVALGWDWVDEQLRSLQEQVCALVQPAQEKWLRAAAIGPVRSGALVACLLSYKLENHVQLVYGPIKAPPVRDLPVVVCDDILDTGATALHALDALRDAGYGGTGSPPVYVLALLARKKTMDALSNHACRPLVLTGAYIEDDDDTWFDFPWETRGAAPVPGYTDAGAQHASPAQHAAPETPEALVAAVLKAIGDDPKRPGLIDTPRRVVRSWKEQFAGYQGGVKQFFRVFDEGVDSMVALTNVEFYSTCEHHMVPFYGRAHIAYIPNNGRVLGVSKLARILDFYAKRLQIQERIGNQVVEALLCADNGLLPLGAACIIEARHLCMCARGVGKQHSRMVTSALRGVFLQPEKDNGGRALNELMHLIGVSQQRE